MKTAAGSAPAPPVDGFDPLEQLATNSDAARSATTILTAPHPRLGRLRARSPRRPVLQPPPCGAPPARSSAPGYARPARYPRVGPVPARRSPRAVRGATTPAAAP